MARGAREHRSPLRFSFLLVLECWLATQVSSTVVTEQVTTLLTRRREVAQQPVAGDPTDEALNDVGESLRSLKKRIEDVNAAASAQERPSYDTGGVQERLEKLQTQIRSPEASRAAAPTEPPSAPPTKVAEPRTFPPDMQSETTPKASPSSESRKQTAESDKEDEMAEEQGLPGEAGKSEQPVGMLPPPPKGRDIGIKDLRPKLYGLAGGIGPACLLIAFILWKADRRSLPKHSRLETLKKRIDSDDYLFKDGQIHRWLPGQIYIESIYAQPLTQAVVVGVILANFVVKACEAQIRPEEGDKLFAWFIFAEWSFNTMFLIELLFNMYGSFFCAFWMNGWNIFDVIVVAMSYASFFSNKRYPFASVLRVFRLGKAARLFRFVPQLQLIVLGLMQALPGVAASFCILLFCIGIWSILGVRLFGAEWPLLYSNLERAIITQFQVTTGDGWVAGVFRPILLLKDAQYHPVVVVLYYVSYAFLTTIVLFNVVVASMVDGYCKAEADMSSHTLEAAYKMLMDAQTWADKKAAYKSLDNSLPHWVSNMLDSQAFLLRMCELFKEFKTMTRDLDDSGMDAEQLYKAFQTFEEDGFKLSVLQTRRLLTMYDDDLHGFVHRAEIVAFFRYALVVCFIEDQLSKPPGQRDVGTSSEADHQVGSAEGRLLPWQGSVKKLYDKKVVQLSIAAIILATFFLCAVEAQIHPKPGTQTYDIFWYAEAVITGIFVVELFTNFYANFFVPFWQDPWNIFDTIVVICSCLQYLNLAMPGVQALRLLRAFRALRLVEFLPGLSHIVKCIFHTLPNVAYAAGMLLIVVAIWSIMGVNLYGDYWKKYYGNFGLGCLSQIQILTFDSWVSEIMRPIVEREGISACLFFITYMFTNSCLILNVVAAIFLAKFVEEKKNAHVIGDTPRSCRTGRASEEIASIKAAAMLSKAGNRTKRSPRTSPGASGRSTPKSEGPDAGAAPSSATSSPTKGKGWSALRKGGAQP